MKLPITLVEREFRQDDTSKFKTAINIVKDISEVDNIADGEQVYDMSNKRVLLKKDGKLMKYKLNDLNDIILEEI